MSKSTRKIYEQPSTFKAFFEIGDDRYQITPITVHPEVAVRAYRVLKVTGAARVAYDCMQQEDGQAECDCIGQITRGHRKPCRHLRTLVAFGCFKPIPPTKKAAPAKAEEPVQVEELAATANAEAKQEDLPIAMPV